MSKRQERLSESQVVLGAAQRAHDEALVEQVTAVVAGELNELHGRLDGLEKQISYLIELVVGLTNEVGQWREQARERGHSSGS